MDFRAWIDDHILLKIPHIKRNHEARTRAAQAELLAEPTEVWNGNKMVGKFAEMYGMTVVIEGIWDHETGERRSNWSGKKYRDTPVGGYGIYTSHADRRAAELNSARKRSLNREWIVQQAPDVCLFM